MKKEVLLFDLDGTLLDTSEDLAAAVNHALSACGYPTRSVKDVQMFLGNGIRRLMELSVPTGTDEDNMLRALELFRAYYASHLCVHTRPYDGISETLRALRASGHKMAVISNKYDAAVRELCRTFFADCIDLAIGDSEGSGMPKKPAPDVLFYAMDRLGVTPDDCIYIGDSEVDVLTAQNAGIPCIGCAWGLRGRKLLEEAGLAPENILDDPAKLADFVPRMQNGI